MKAYLITTGGLFGLMAVVHVFRAIAEWPASVGAGFLAEMGLLIFLPGALAWWAWRLVRKLKTARNEARRWKN